MNTAGLTEGLTPSGGAVAPVWIEVIDGPSRGARVRLDGGTLFVGSGEGVDLKLDDPAVSRRHASFELLAGQVRVRDLGSRNGVRYLGGRVSEVEVPLGSTLELGRSSVSVRSVAEEPLPPSVRSELAGLVGRSLPLRRVFALLERLAPVDTSVLFLGESGTGKEAAARALHQLSPRAKLPFVVVECAGASPELLESRLFGHARGSFTGAERDVAGLVELAGTGTLFFDEVGALSLELQPRLLRLLEAREFHRIGEGRVRTTAARFLASSQEDLERAVEEGRFRRDLYYRLAGAVVPLPALRDRREDIAVLAHHFARALRGADVKLSTATIAALQSEGWVGNVRELRNAVERAFALGQWQEDAVDAQRLGSFHQAREEVVRAFERDFLEALLERHAGNLSAAAREAGLARSAFYRILERHRLR